MQELNVVEDNRMSKLIIGLILDGIGMLTYSVFGFAEFGDII